MEQIHYLYRRKNTNQIAHSKERSRGLKRSAHLFRQNECAALDDVSQSILKEECKTVGCLNSRQEEMVKHPGTLLTTWKCHLRPNLEYICTGHGTSAHIYLHRWATIYQLSNASSIMFPSLKGK